MRHPDKHARSSVQRQVRNGSTLDSTSVRGPSPATAATTAGQAADDDAEEGDDGVDDRLKTSSDGVDNGHDAVSDGAELLGSCQQLVHMASRQRRKGYIHTIDLMQDTTAPIVAVLFLCVFW